MRESVPSGRLKANVRMHTLMTSCEKTAKSHVVVTMDHGLQFLQLHPHLDITPRRQIIMLLKVS